MKPRSRSRIVKQTHQLLEPSNQGTHVFSYLHLFQAYSDIEYRLDVHEDIEKNVVTATFDFPGFSDDDVQINFQNGKLTVSAEAKKAENHPEKGYTLRERIHGKLSRTLQLPEGVQVCRSLISMIFE